MALLPLCSVKGAPGVTTAACALGAVWPERRPTPIVVECDPAGGDLAARFGLEVTRGVVSLTVALEREHDVAVGGRPEPPPRARSAAARRPPRGGGAHVARGDAAAARPPRRGPLDPGPCGLRRHRRLRPPGELGRAGANTHCTADPAGGCRDDGCPAHPGGDSASPRLAAVPERAPRAGARADIPAGPVPARGDRRRPRHPGDRHPPVRPGGCRGAVGRWPGHSRPEPRAAPGGARRRRCAGGRLPATAPASAAQPSAQPGVPLPLAEGA